MMHLFNSYNQEKSKEQKEFEEKLQNQKIKIEEILFDLDEDLQNSEIFIQFLEKQQELEVIVLFIQIYISDSTLTDIYLTNFYQKLKKQQRYLKNLNKSHNDLLNKEQSDTIENSELDDSTQKEDHHNQQHNLTQLLPQQSENKNQIDEYYNYHPLTQQENLQIHKQLHKLFMYASENSKFYQFLSQNIIEIMQFLLQSYQDQNLLCDILLFDKTNYLKQQQQLYQQQEEQDQIQNQNQQQLQQNEFAQNSLKNVQKQKILAKITKLSKQTFTPSISKNYQHKCSQPQPMTNLLFFKSQQFQSSNFALLIFKMSEINLKQFLNLAYSLPLLFEIYFQNLHNPMITKPLKTILVKKSQEEKKYSLARFCKNIEQYKIQKQTSLEIIEYLWNTILSENEDDDPVLENAISIFFEVLDASYEKQNGFSDLKSNQYHYNTNYRQHEQQQYEQFEGEKKFFSRICNTEKIKQLFEKLWQTKDSQNQYQTTYLSEMKNSFGQKYEGHFGVGKLELLNTIYIIVQFHKYLDFSLTNLQNNDKIKEEMDNGEFNIATQISINLNENDENDKNENTLQIQPDLKNPIQSQIQNLNQKQEPENQNEIEKENALENEIENENEIEIQHQNDQTNFNFKNTKKIIADYELEEEDAEAIEDIKSANISGFQKGFYEQNSDHEHSQDYEHNYSNYSSDKQEEESYEARQLKYQKKKEQRQKIQNCVQQNVIRLLNALANSNVYVLLYKLLIKNKWNNILHSQIYKIIKETILSDCQNLIASLTKGKIEVIGYLDKIQNQNSSQINNNNQNQNQNLNNNHSGIFAKIGEKQEMNFGNIGPLINIMLLFDNYIINNQVEESGYTHKCDENIQHEFKNSKAWEQFKKKQLNSIKEIWHNYQWDSHNFLDKDINLEQKWVSQIYKNNGEFRRMNSSGSDQEGLMTDDQDLKQIIINRALQGCGNNDCQNVYCKSSKNFKFHNFGEAQIPNLVTNPQIMQSYQVCQSANDSHQLSDIEIEKQKRNSQSELFQADYSDSDSQNQDSKKQNLDILSQNSQDINPQCENLNQQMEQDENQLKKKNSSSNLFIQNNLGIQPEIHLNSNFDPENNSFQGPSISLQRLIDQGNEKNENKINYFQREEEYDRQNLSENLNQQQIIPFKTDQDEDEQDEIDNEQQQMQQQQQQIQNESLQNPNNIPFKSDSIQIQDESQQQQMEQEQQEIELFNTMENQKVSDFFNNSDNYNSNNGNNNNNNINTNSENVKNLNQIENNDINIIKDDTNFINECDHNNNNNNNNNLNCNNTMQIESDITQTDNK